MAHETHHDTHHADAHSDHHHHVEVETRPTTSYWSAFWFVLILVGLFVAAVNFVGVMGHDDGGHGESGHAKEGAVHHTNREATASQTLEGETGTGVDAGHTNTDGTGMAPDSTHAETAPHAAGQH
jgi:hypothetical protein